MTAKTKKTEDTKATADDLSAPRPGMGHNGGPPLDDEAAEEGDGTTDAGGVSVKRLKQLIERVERLEEEKASIASDIKDVYGEAKSTGFDTKTMRKLVRLRKMDEQKRNEEDELLDLYRAAIGL